MTRPTRKLPCLLAIPFLLAACGGTPQTAPAPPADMGALPREEPPSLATVKPPEQPRLLNEHRFFLSARDEIDRLPLPEQPRELTAALLGLEQGSVAERVAKLKKKAVADLAYVRGGSFLRGAFADRLEGEYAYSISNIDDKHLKEVTLSDFWIGKYKATYAEFDVFTDATGRPRTGMENDGDNRHPLLPAGAHWPEAKAYCLWLGEITGYPFDLPTEAQWEYAARSRGQFFTTPTDDGNQDMDRNSPSARHAENIAGKYARGLFASRYPVGLFPANPLGLYDMAYLALEWVNDWYEDADWYAEDAYEQAAVRDPQGPASGEEKVMRGGDGGSGWGLYTNISRHSKKPVLYEENEWDADGKPVPYSTAYSPTLRCVVNSTPKRP
jgi:formylglycine-generating enzyme required for sulfatase activity